MAEKPDHHVKYTFNTEWFDTQASLTRHYQLYYFPVDKTIEMVRLEVEDSRGPRPLAALTHGGFVAHSSMSRTGARF